MEDAANSIDYPSLDVVRAELDVRVAEQERRGAAFDSRSGLVMAFGGVLIGIAPGESTALQLVAQLLAAAAAAIAGSVLIPQRATAWGSGSCATATSPPTRT